MNTTGPLQGVRIIELAGMGPVPFAGMMLSGMGAEVFRVDRPDPAKLSSENVKGEFLNRGRRSLALDLKHPSAKEVLLRMTESSHAILEGFRPGVMERLGLGPDILLDRNASLVYGRMTGWGQDGPNAAVAGHDLNFIGLTGALNAIGRAGSPPTPPLGLVGDFGGGGMLLALGVVSAIFEASCSGQGQVIDASILDGVALLSTMFYSGSMGGPRGTNLGDSGCHFYDVYETADERYISLAAIEGQFYEEFLRLSGLDSVDVPHSFEPTDWPPLKEKISDRIRTKTLEEWMAIFEGTNACVSPVLTWSEAPSHPHNQARGTFIEIGGYFQPAPGPRFSRTPLSSPRVPVASGSDTREVLVELGYSDREILSLIEAEVVR